MSRIYWDTMMFLYWLEDRPPYAARVDRIYSRIKERGDHLQTSTLSVGETLAGPYKHQDRAMAAVLESFFASGRVELLPFTTSAAREYAKIRATTVVSRPDAIHLACAADAGTDVFITNDQSLVGKTVPGIQFIVGLNTELY